MTPGTQTTTHINIKRKVHMTGKSDTSSDDSKLRENWAMYLKTGSIIFLAVCAGILLGLIVFLVPNFRDLRETTTQETSDPVSSINVTDVVPTVDGPASVMSGYSPRAEDTAENECYKLKIHPLDANSTLTLSLNPETEVVFIQVRNGERYGISAFIDDVWTQPIFGTQEELQRKEETPNLSSATKVKLYSGEDYRVNIWCSTKEKLK